MNPAALVTIVSTDALPLDDLKAKIKEEHDLYRKFQKKAHEAEKTSLEHAIACGRMLIELKKRVKHGHLNSELRQIGVKPRMASNYARIALKSATVADLPCGTIKGALAHLTNEKRLAEDKPTPPAPIEADIVPDTRPPSKGITVDAVIVEKEDHQEDEPTAPAAPPAPPPEKPEAQGRVPKWIPDDAERLWLLAKIDLDKILPSDASRERILCNVISYCETRLDLRPLNIALAQLPKMSKAEITQLLEIINSRWT